MSTPETTAVTSTPGPAPKAQRLDALTFALGAALIVVLVGLVAALVTWTFHPSPSAPCTIHCPGVASVSMGSGLIDEPKTYRNKTFGFTVEQGPHWSSAGSGSSGAGFNTQDGYFEITGAKGTINAVQMIRDRLSSLSGQVFPDLKDSGPIRGAHIGTVPAQGELYVGTYVPQSGGGQSFLVAVGVMVAHNKGITVRAFALGPYDQNHDQLHGGLDPAATDIDYALDEFRWPGQ